jgi:hypothetical protein
LSVLVSNPLGVKLRRNKIGDKLRRYDWNVPIQVVLIYHKDPVASTAGFKVEFDLKNSRVRDRDIVSLVVFELGK